MISVIICSNDETKFRKVTQCYTEKLAGESFEIIGIHDAKSLCEGYNRGIAQSSGNILVFSHDDIEILSPDFARKLTVYLSTYDIIGVAGTSKLVSGHWAHAGAPHLHGQVAHAIPSSTDLLVAIYGTQSRVAEKIHALDGVFFALNRRVIDRVRFDQETFDGFHHYDLDFTFSAYLAGFRLAVCNDIIILHQSQGKFGEIWERYRDKFEAKHQVALLENRRTMNTNIALRVKTREEVLAVCERTIGKVS